MEVLYDLRGWCRSESDLLSQLMYDCMKQSTKKPLANAFRRLEKGGSGGVTVDMVRLPFSCQARIVSLTLRWPGAR